MSDGGAHLGGDGAHPLDKGEVAEVIAAESRVVPAEVGRVQLGSGADGAGQVRELGIGFVAYSPLGRGLPAA